MYQFEPALHPHHRLEVHLLKTRAANNINRDDLGKPKEMYLGGVCRQRVSSQSDKAAIRRSDSMKGFREKVAKKYPMHELIRTTRVAHLFAEMLNRDHGIETEAATAVAKRVANQMAKFEPKSGKTQLVATSRGELETIYKHLIEIAEGEIPSSSKEAEVWADDRLKLMKKELNSRIVRGDFSPEIQLFGRMMTNQDNFAPVDSALQTMHAFTTHEVPLQRDYWTGTDDIRNKNFDDLLVKPTDEDEIKKVRYRHSGSAMLEVRRFSSGVYYHYYCIDLALLKNNMQRAYNGHSTDEVTEICADLVGYFMLAAIGEQPSGHQTGLATPVIADLVAAGIGTGFPICAAAAFEKPVEAGEGGYLHPSIARFTDWYRERRELNRNLMSELSFSGVGERDKTYQGLSLMANHEELVSSIAATSYQCMQKMEE